MGRFGEVFFPQNIHPLNLGKILHQMYFQRCIFIGICSGRISSDNYSNSRHIVSPGQLDTFMKITQINQLDNLGMLKATRVYIMATITLGTHSVFSARCPWELRWKSCFFSTTSIDPCRFSFFQLLWKESS